MLKKTIISLVLGLSLVTAAPGHAACYADYKAKQENPLRLHYGVVKISDAACSNGRAASIVKQRLAARGWSLLKVCRRSTIRGWPRARPRPGGTSSSSDPAKMPADRSARLISGGRFLLRKARRVTRGGHYASPGTRRVRLCVQTSW